MNAAEPSVESKRPHTIDATRQHVTSDLGDRDRSAPEDERCGTLRVARQNVRTRIRYERCRIGHERPEGPIGDVVRSLSLVHPAKSRPGVDGTLTDNLQE